MLRFYADRFVRAYDDIVGLRIILNSPQLNPADTLSTEPLKFEARLKSLAEQLEAIGMEFTLISVRKLLQEMKGGSPLTVELLKSRTGDIQVRLNDELEKAVFFCVETHPEYIDPIVPLFGIEVANKFAGATFDLEQAGRCLALDLTTAAVFHSMRVLEIGIKSVSSCLAIPAPLKDSERTGETCSEKLKMKWSGETNQAP